ncbi:MAG: hypothetical protein IPJ34_41890 [Myxococcales bacterium]|nr:hypothetical protein [Myxococcales bacterium]
MMTCEYQGEPLGEPRSHPWTDAVSDAAFRYHDLRATPALIRSALEDFVPFETTDAVEAFYGLLEWLNAPGSSLESNDCAFTGPADNEHPAFSQRLGCSGRLMILRRALARNVVAGSAERLAIGLHRALARLEPEFTAGIVGTTLVPVRFLALPPKARLGQQLMISFWAFGETEAEVMENLLHVVRNLSSALRALA